MKDKMYVVTLIVSAPVHVWDSCMFGHKSIVLNYDAQLGISRWTLNVKIVANVPHKDPKLRDYGLVSHRRRCSETDPNLER